MPILPIGGLLLHADSQKDLLIVLSHGKAPYKVVLGVPHQAAVGERIICDQDKERKKPKASDENAASYALVAFSLLKQHDIPCKTVIAAHSTQEDPNKNLKSHYCHELFSEPSELIWECHGLGPNRELDLELSAGSNYLTDTLKYGHRLASALRNVGDIGIQKKAGQPHALIIRKDGTENSNGVLERAGIDTVSLEEARRRNIISLHLEAKPRFRISDNQKDDVTHNGYLLGRAMAEAIIQDWVDTELAKVEKTYTTQILNMTGAYRREIEIKKEYQGRQLLELLQNADDEAADIKNPGVLIRLEQDKLIVANHGLPFTAQGILSLMYSNNSPKIKQQRKIGYKGLGFRAILNWSSSIWIKSGAFSLEFSRDNAVEFLKRMICNNSGLKEEIEKSGTGEYPIATLAAPRWKPPNTFNTSEYDTYVIIAFSSEEVRKNIQDQINELRLEVALFLNNIKAIKLDSPERNETIMRLPPEEGDYEEIRLLDQTTQIKDSKRWRIFQKTDELPANLRDETVNQYEYDLRIAISKHMDDTINRLFSYFKTEVKLPFPAIIHGTFELDGNRNHLTETKVNEFLLERLTELMTEAAMRIAESRDMVTWDAMKLLARRGELDDKLEKMGFYKKLLTAIKKEHLIPVLSNKYMSALEKPTFYDIPLAEILKTTPTEFPELSLYTPDKEIHALLRENELAIGPYRSAELVRRLNKTSATLSSQNRANLIVLLVDNYDKCLKPLTADKMPSLFIDEQGHIISANTKSLLPPEGATFQLPEFTRIVFISGDLTERLAAKTSAKSNRVLAEKLSRFNVTEYNAATVMGRIVAATNRSIRKAPAKQTGYIQNMVDSLFRIFSDKSNQGTKFPERINVPLSTRKGELRSAKELYFGRDYSIGKIMDALYSGVNDTIFVAGKDELGLATKTEDEAVKFLKWVGVEEFPRIGLNKLEGQTFDLGYEAFVLKNLKYPYTTTLLESYHDYSELEADRAYRSVITVHDIPELDSILSKAKFEHILGWLHFDPKIQEILRKGCEPSGSSFGVWFKQKRQIRSLRDGEISPYIVWKLRNSKWVTAKSGKKVAPTHCCLSDALDGMSPLIEIPVIDQKEQVLKELSVDLRDLRYVLAKIGASEDFSSLPTETVYGILTNLEAADSEGSKAKSIYTGIVRSKPKEWDSTLKESDAYRLFIKDGKILTMRDGQKAYMPVNKAYYVDNITFCKEIMTKFPIAEIPRRSGKERVKDIFGVSPLEDIGFTLDSEPDLNPINSKFSQYFEAFKPYALVFRHGTAKFSAELSSLKRLKIYVCKRINAKYSYNSQEGELTLNPYEHIQPYGENSVYILLPREYKDMAELKKDLRFCDAIAEIISGVLRVDENRKDYRELFPKDREERTTIIKSDLDDPTMEKLREVRKKFRDVSDLQKEFWQTILITKGITKELSELPGDEAICNLLSNELGIEETFLKEVFQGIDYDDLSTFKNIALINKLFTTLQISIKKFNFHSVEQIDFSAQFKSEVASIKYKLQKKFQAFTYQALKDRDALTKETFSSLLSAYEITSFTEHYDINEELDTNKEKCFNLAFQQEPFKKLYLTYSALIKQEELPIENIYIVNKEDFVQKLEGFGGAYKDDITAFLENPQNKSLLFFGEFTELVRRFYTKYSKPSQDGTEGGGQITKKKKTLPLNGKDEEYEDNEYKSILNNIKEDLQNNQYEISKHDPSRPPEKPSGGHTGGTGGGYIGHKQQYTTETGFIGEVYVYEKLLEKYGNDKVLWVSENAKKANVNPQGSESYGYDMHYIDENDKLHYVEVKSSSSNDNAFKISPEEVRFGEQHRKDYAVIQVLNALNQNRDIRNLGHIFDYAEEESFNNNSKFTVENDRYTIRFK